MDVECHIRECSLEVALDWMRDTFGDVRCIESTERACYEASLSGAAVSIIIMFTDIENGPFCWLYCGGHMLPWASDAEMAHAAYAFTRLPVRWSTGADDPCDWWQLDTDGERRIAWH